jgi:hypothetical protein
LGFLLASHFSDIGYTNKYSSFEMAKFPKIKSVLQLYEMLPENERTIFDILRQIVIENLPEYCKEKISYNVPFFFGNKGICIIWPATIPRGGIKEGVLFGFWYGYKLKDLEKHLDKGTNKQIYYKIYRSPNEINETALVKLLKEAVTLDASWKSEK